MTPRMIRPAGAAAAPTFLSSGGKDTAVAPLDTSPFAIAKTNLKRLVREAIKGDAKAVRQLVEISCEASRAIEAVFRSEDGKAALTDVVQDFEALPVMHGPRRPTPSAQRMSGGLPVGARVEKKKRGKHDALNMELRELWLPLFAEIRREGWHGSTSLSQVGRNPKVWPAIGAVLDLPTLSRRTANKWATVVVEWWQADHRPLYDPKIWTYTVAAPDAQLRKRQQRARSKILRTNPATPIEDAVARTNLAAVDRWTVNKADVRNGLIDKIAGRLRQLVPESRKEKSGT